MTIIEKAVVAVALVATYLVARYERTTTPTNYNECILEHMPGTPTTGVVDVRQACKVLSPPSNMWKDAGFEEVTPRPAD